MAEYLNRYRCPDCDHTWHDVWDCGCDDECPDCGARHISPESSDILEEEA